MANNKVRPKTYSDCKSRLRGKGVFLIDTLTNGNELRLSLFNCKYNIPPITNCNERKINCVSFKNKLK